MAETDELVGTGEPVQRSLAGVWVCSPHGKTEEPCDNCSNRIMNRKHWTDLTLHHKDYIAIVESRYHWVAPWQDKGTPSLYHLLVEVAKAQPRWASRELAASAAANPRRIE